MNKLYKYLFASLFLVGCGANDADKALSLLDDANEAISNNDFDLARNLLDSLRYTYPNEIEARRKAVDLSNLLELNEAKSQLSVADSIFTFKCFELEDLKKDFTLEKQEKYQTTGYYVTNDYAGSKSAYSFFPEVEEGGALLLVSITRSPQIKYDFEEVEVDLNSDVVPAAKVSHSLSEKEQDAYVKCYKLARCIKEYNEAKALRDKMDMKIRFFEKKMSLGE